MFFTFEPSTSDEPRKIYLFFFILTGILMATLLIQPFHKGEFTVCLFKNSLGVPCPGCGMTRAFLFLGHGDIYEALRLNPNSLLVFSIILFLWLNKITLILTGKEVKIHYTQREKVLLYFLSGFAIVFAWVYNMTLNPWV